MRRPASSPAVDLLREMAWFFGVISLGCGALLRLKLRPRMSLGRYLPVYALKLVAQACAPVAATLGAFGAAIGMVVCSPLSALAGLVGALLSARYVIRVTAPHDGFERAFGASWRDRVDSAGVPYRLRRRWAPRQVRRVTEGRVARDVAFWTVPGSERELLCDIWQPPDGIAPSGLGLVYLHGGAWQSLDKDRGTRPLFRHLAGQGHLIMDVAYRLCQETDMYGIIADVKRAIVWLKAHAAQYGVDPEHVVTAGASAGGHLALLAAYTPYHAALGPDDVRGQDETVCGVISYYGLPDLRHLGTGDSEASSPLFLALSRRAGLAEEEHYDPPELARRLFGASAAQAPVVAALMSPITHVGSHCPPTLLLQGTHDHITRTADVHTLHAALCASGVPAVYVERPQVEHVFDMLALPISPPAQAALYDVERFLSLLARVVQP